MFQVFHKLGTYMGNRKWLLPCSIVLSAVHGLLSLVPFVCLWLVVRTLLTSQANLSSSPIWHYAVTAFVVAVISLLVYFSALTLSHLVAFRLETNMRRKAMKHLLQAPLGFLESHNTGEMRKVIDEDSSKTHSFVAHSLPDVAASVVAPLGVVVMMFVVDWVLGLVCMIPVVASFAMLGVMMKSEGQHFQRLYLDAQEKMSNEAVEYVRGIPVVKVFQQTVFSFKRFYDSIVSYRDLVTHYTKLWRNIFPLYTLIINAFGFFLVPTAILMTAHQGDTMTIVADLILYMVIVPVVGGSIMKIMYLANNLYLCNEAIARTEKLTTAQPLEECESPQVPLRLDVDFNHVSFRYEGAKTDAVKNISLHIAQGSTVALVGPSGSGKTTIARLIPRFWDVREGTVSIGGINVKQIDKEWLMRHVSFVFQNTRLFHNMSILDNVCYGSPQASMDEINRAIALSQSREIIDRLPQGLRTVIGAGGTYLSGGEQQRIVLARAILKNAPIVVLDEATAFADPENEHLIRKALAQLTKGKTVLMIAHRLTTITDADNIVVVDQGQIAQQGTHSSLLQARGIYERMWNEYQKSIDWEI